MYNKRMAGRKDLLAIVTISIAIEFAVFLLLNICQNRFNFLILFFSSVKF